MFSPATALDAERGRSCKKAAMNFIKTVCLKGRRPSPTFIPFSEQLVSSESESRSNSPAPEFPRKKIIIEVPDPKEKGKYIKVKGEAKNIKFLKDCDLNPYVDLGTRVPHTKEGIQAFVYKDIIQNRLNKMKEKDKKVTKNVDLKPKQATLPKNSKGMDVDKLPQKNSGFLKSSISNKSLASKIQKSEVSSDKKKRITYQEKIENLKFHEKNFDDLDILDDPDDSFNGGESKTLAELRESLRQTMKKGDGDKKSIKDKLADILPKVGARKNVNRPLKPKLPGSPVNQNQSSIANSVTNKAMNSPSGKDPAANERVFVVMPDGSMVEVSTAKAAPAGTASVPDVVKSTSANEEETTKKVTPAKEKPKSSPRVNVSTNFD